MTTLDRYIARQYLFNVIALLVILFSFVVAVDVALNLDRFVRGAEHNLGADGVDTIRKISLTTAGVFDIWWPRLLQLYVYLIGLVQVAGMGFTFTQLVRHREMVAVLAGGVSLYRVMAPILIVAAVMLGLKVIDQEFILSNPRIAPLLTRDPGDIGQRDWAEFPVLLAPDAQDRIWLARAFDPRRGELSDVTVWVRSGGQAQYAIHADRAVWRDGAWELTGSKVQSMELGAGGTPVLGGKDLPKPPARLETDLDPHGLKLRQFKVYGQLLSWSQVGEMLERTPEGSTERRSLQAARWARVSQIASALLALLITMPFFLVREPTNMLVQSLKCAPVGILSLMGGVLLSTVDWPLIPPGFAVFIPVLILIPVAIAVVSWMRT